VRGFESARGITIPHWTRPSKGSPPSAFARAVGAARFVERVERRHVGVGESEVEDPGVFLDSIAVGRLREDDEVPLHTPAEEHLGRRPAHTRGDLVVSSLDRSLGLYRELLGPLGYTRVGEIVGERGERVVYLSGTGIVPFSLRETQTPGDHDRYRIGLHHVAFEASSRALVDDRLRWARAQGLEIENDPKSTTTDPATTRVSSTTRTGSSSRSSTSRDGDGRRRANCR
jgi:catechol 2,3-dioxygenase-like lactoylglutathione lyase family enzyme